VTIGWSAWARLSWAALRRVARHPVEMLRVAAHLETRDGRALARHLLRRYPPEFDRRVAMALLAADDSNLKIEFERDGLRWCADVGSLVAIELYSSGTYEGPAIEAILDWLRARKPSGTIVDAGANIGTTSIPFALAGYHVIAIEPIPATFAMLVTNVERNGLSDRVTCIQSAVSQHSGEIAMWTGAGSGQSEVAVEGSDPSMTRWAPARELLPVPAGALDELLDEHGVDPTDVALVWADVQGSETDVIRTGAGLWANRVPLYLEVDPTMIELHAGIDGFTAAVRTSFGAFLSRDDLVAARSEQPIERFGAWLASIRPNEYSDALLIPRDEGSRGIRAEAGGSSSSASRILRDVSCRRSTLGGPH